MTDTKWVPVTQNVTRIDPPIRPDSLILPLKWPIFGVYTVCGGGVSGWSGGRIGGPIGVTIGSQLTPNWGPHDCTDKQLTLQRDLCQFVLWSGHWRIEVPIGPDWSRLKNPLLVPSPERPREHAKIVCTPPIGGGYTPPLGVTPPGQVPPLRLDFSRF